MGPRIVKVPVEKVIVQGGRAVRMKVLRRITNIETAKFVKVEPKKLYVMKFDVIKPPKSKREALIFLGKSFLEMRKNGIKPLFWKITNRRLIVQGVGMQAGRGLQQASFAFPLIAIGIILVAAIAAGLFFGIQMALKEVAIGIVEPFKKPEAAIAAGISIFAILAALAGGAYLLSRPSISRGAREAIKIGREEVVKPAVEAVRAKLP